MLDCNWVQIYNILQECDSWLQTHIFQLLRCDQARINGPSHLSLASNSTRVFSLRNISAFRPKDKILQTSSRTRICKGSRQSLNFDVIWRVFSIASCGVSIACSITAHCIKCELSCNETISPVERGKDVFLLILSSPASCSQPVWFEGLESLQKSTRCQRFIFLTCTGFRRVIWTGLQKISNKCKMQ